MRIIISLESFSSSSSSESYKLNISSFILSNASATNKYDYFNQITTLSRKIFSLSLSKLMSLSDKFIISDIVVCVESSFRI